MFNQSILFATLAATVMSQEDSAATPLLGATHFRNWMNLHQKSYDSDHVLNQRLQIWLENDKLIREHNRNPKKTFTVGHNEYSDMTSDEFHAYFKLGKHSKMPDLKKMRPVRDDKEAVEVANQRRALMELSKLSLPESVNWVEEGAVTGVKNQGNCGSCWAFSATGSMEGSLFIETGELVGLSEQELMDCDLSDYGCEGGLMDPAFIFVHDNGGLCSEEDYPYTAKQGSCQENLCTSVANTRVENYVDVEPGSVSGLMAAIAMQPVSVAVSAGNLYFQFYSSGVINDDGCGGQIDHGVLAVGYGKDLTSGLDYWLVKNSWGETWGEEGYLKIGRESNNTYGMCSILELSSFPILG